MQRALKRSLEVYNMVNDELTNISRTTLLLYYEVNVRTAYWSAATLILSMFPDVQAMTSLAYISLNVM